MIHTIRPRVNINTVQQSWCYRYLQKIEQCGYNSWEKIFEMKGKYTEVNRSPWWWWKNIESNQSELHSASEEKEIHVDLTEEMTDKTEASIYP